MPFTKFRPLVELQIRNRVNISSETHKLNRMMCAELITILAEVVRELIKELLASETTHFVCLAGDGTDARKTREEKESVYLKCLANGFKGHVTLSCLLRCFNMRDSGGPNAVATFDVMKRTLLEYIPSEEEAKARLIIVCADGASVDFGCHSGAFTQLQEWAGHLLLLMHFLNASS